MIQILQMIKNWKLHFLLPQKLIQLFGLFTHFFPTVHL